MSSQKPELTLHDGDRAELGQRMLRAHLERRYDDSREMAKRIARRGSLKAVIDEAASPDTHALPSER